MPAWKTPGGTRYYLISDLVERQTSPAEPLVVAMTEELYFEGLVMGVREIDQRDLGSGGTTRRTEPDNKERTDFERSFLATCRTTSEVAKVGIRMTSKLFTSHWAA